MGEKWVLGNEPRDGEQGLVFPTAKIRDTRKVDFHKAKGYNSSFSPQQYAQTQKESNSPYFDHSPIHTKVAIPIQ